jgi:hypothetical protein
VPLLASLGTRQGAVQPNSQNVLTRLAPTQQDDWLDFDEPEDLPPNIIRFRPAFASAHTAP